MSDIQNRLMTTAEIAVLAAPIIELPPFEEGGPRIPVRVKRPDLMGLVQAGKIPNELLGVSMQALEPEKMVETLTKDESQAEKSMQDAMKLVDILLENTLVSPKWHDLVEELGCEFKDLITEEQRNYLLAYAGGGMKALATFREGPGQPVKAGGKRKSVGSKTK